MRQDTSIASAWSRFSAYEVRDGCVRPAPGATLEHYDPWALYAGSRRGRAVAPYQALLALLPELTFRQVARGRQMLTPDAEQRLAAWCAEYGLLGVLPHRVLMVAFTDTIDPITAPIGATVGPHERHYVRTPRGWNVAYRSLASPVAVAPGTTAPSTDALPPARVLIADLRNGMLGEEPIPDTWAHFFPTISPTQRTQGQAFPYPLPLTEEFWDAYAEPVEYFVDAAYALADALGTLVPREDTDDEELATAYAAGVQQLNALVAPIGPFLTSEPRGNEDPRLVQRWASPSLLATFALMALQDLAAGLEPRECVICSRLFLSATPSALYCSTRCRYTAQKRVQRARAPRKAARAPRRTPTRSSTHTTTPKE